MFALVIQNSEQVTELTKYPVIAMFLFLFLFIGVTIYTLTADKKDMEKWSEIPLDDAEIPNQEN
ncbi:MAG: hypothetical protein QNK30_04475 [Bacteroidales bacterium]|nr:hypothetical protein [Bacteroidales bacterium]